MEYKVKGRLIHSIVLNGNFLVAGTILNEKLTKSQLIGFSKALSPNCVIQECKPKTEYFVRDTRIPIEPTKPVKSTDIAQPIKVVEVEELEQIEEIQEEILKEEIQEVVVKPTPKRQYKKRGAK